MLKNIHGSNMDFEDNGDEVKAHAYDKSGKKYHAGTYGRKDKSFFVKLKEEVIGEGRNSDEDAEEVEKKRKVSKNKSTAYKDSEKGWVGQSKKYYNAVEKARNKGVKEEVEINEKYEGMEHMSDAAHELVMHADNHAQLHHGSHMPIIRNLAKKKAKGTYDSEKAKKLWGYHADRAAQSYHKEYGDKHQPWHKMFTTDDRKQAAAHWESANRDELHEGTKVPGTNRRVAVGRTERKLQNDAERDNRTGRKPHEKNSQRCVVPGCSKSYNHSGECKK